MKDKIVIGCIKYLLGLLILVILLISLYGCTTTSELGCRDLPFDKKSICMENYDRYKSSYELDSKVRPVR